MKMIRKEQIKAVCKEEERANDFLCSTSSTLHHDVLIFMSIHRTLDSGLGTRDSGLGTRDSGLWTLESAGL